MSQAFNAKAGLILVEAEVSGPTGKAVATLVLDTGATSTAINRNLLRTVGYDPDSATEFVRMTTARVGSPIDGHSGQHPRRVPLAARPPALQADRKH